VFLSLWSRARADERERKRQFIKNKEAESKEHGTQKHRTSSLGVKLAAAVDHLKQRW